MCHLNVCSLQVKRQITDKGFDKIYVYAGDEQILLFWRTGENGAGYRALTLMLTLCHVTVNSFQVCF